MLFDSAVSAGGCIIHICLYLQASPASPGEKRCVLKFLQILLGVASGMPGEFLTAWVCQFFLFFLSLSLSCEILVMIASLVRFGEHVLRIIFGSGSLA